MVKGTPPTALQTRKVVGSVRCVEEKGTRGVIKSDARGNYVYPITMKRKNKKESSKIDIGFADPNQFAPVAEEDEDEYIVPEPTPKMRTLYRFLMGLIPAILASF